MYNIHPSYKLMRLFSEKPFQGCHPNDAAFLFVGQDANYSESIESNGIFKELLEYHQDGVAFWKKYKKHHPFLLSNYSGDRRKDGCRYHREFSKIGFTPDQAHLVSFVELLHVPTFGCNKLKIKDLSFEHLIFLNNAILYGKAKYVFISPTLAELMRKSGTFPWLPRQAKKIDGQLGIWFENNKVTVFRHLHFSAQQSKTIEFTEIKKLIEGF